MSDTIYALSSGAPPAAIGVMRISGPDAAAALTALAGSLPDSRKASLRNLRDPAGDVLDQALVLWFPGPATSTGEDLAELHLHGGRAVVAAVERVLARIPGLRRAEPGEFTRRAFANGRIDLAEAEGLADLLTAETEIQRRHAMTLANGVFSAHVNDWREQVLMAGAQIEAVLDFGDEDDVGELPTTFTDGLRRLTRQVDDVLAQPAAEQLREGFRVVLAGPPNSGKSSLFNALVGDNAAIATPIAGTTRDVLSRPVAIEGIPFLFVDTAGLRQATDDTIEEIGIARARSELERADLVLWLGPERQGEGRAVWELESFADLHRGAQKMQPRHRISAETGEGVTALRRDLVQTARAAMPMPGSYAVNARQREILREVRDALRSAAGITDLLIMAEALRTARAGFDRILGYAATEDMLDVLFSRFCIGK